MKTVFSTLMLLFLGVSISSAVAKESSKPNIIIIYLDDLAYGDLSCYGSTQIATPHIDKLAAGGVRFESAHTTSSTCTPSRYGLLTGEYPWKREAHVLNGDAPMIIDKDQHTLPKALKANGYNTAIVGKWHLGLGDGNIDWNEKIELSPRAVGFDYEYIIAATNDRVPSVYVENQHVVGLNPDDPIEVNYKKNFEGQPTGKDNPELLKFLWSHGHNNSITNGISRIGFMKGGNAAIWNDEQQAEVFFTKACDYIDSQADEDAPFFLYYALHQPHVPRVPSPRFEGKSHLGPRGDVILEADWYVGEFMEKLEQDGLLENTLIIFSSDNGGVLDDGYHDQSKELGAKFNYNPNDPLRGSKYSLYEGGTRVPFITYWKGTIKPGVSDQLMSQLDIAATLTALTGGEWDATEESTDQLSALLGQGKSSRDHVLLEGGKVCMTTSDNWSYIPAYNMSNWGDAIGLESGLKFTEPQIYDLSNDIGQKVNLAKENPKKLKQLEKKFAKEVGPFYMKKFFEKKKKK